MNNFDKTWEDLKKEEKGESTVTEGLIRIPNELPALIKAEKIQKNMEFEFAKFQLSNNSKQDSNGYLNMFKYIKNNQIFFKTYFKLESISMNMPTQYRIELAEKYYNNKYIDYHIEFFRAGLNAVIKKWINNGCKETPEEINEIITSEYKNKN